MLRIGVPDRLLGFTLTATRGNLLAGVSGSVGCGRSCHEATWFPFEGVCDRVPVQVFPYETGEGHVGRTPVAKPRQSPWSTEVLS